MSAALSPANHTNKIKGEKQNKKEEDEMMRMIYCNDVFVLDAMLTIHCCEVRQVWLRV